jgi:hypothetical protein
VRQVALVPNVVPVAAHVARRLRGMHTSGTPAMLSLKIVGLTFHVETARQSTAGKSLAVPSSAAVTKWLRHPVVSAALKLLSWSVQLDVVDVCVTVPLPAIRAACTFKVRTPMVWGRNCGAA